MKTKLTKMVLLMSCALLIALASGCGVRRTALRGQVVDEVTGSPVGGAVIAVRWFDYEHWPLGIEGSRDVDIDDAEAVSDAGGRFEIPGYRPAYYNMGVYKKGYVCWMSDQVFPTWEPRRGFRMGDGMVIRLEPFRESYSEFEHARFTILGIDSCTSLGSSDGKYYQAIEPERLLYRQKVQERKRRREKEK